MNQQATQERLQQLRHFWAASRAAHGEKGRAARDSAHKALSARLRDWAAEVRQQMTTAPASLEEAVIHAYAHIILACVEQEMSPAWETFCQPPEAVGWPSAGQWRVCWESGPDWWGVRGGVVPQHVRKGQGWHTEPHWQFDLCFVDTRDH